MSNALRLIVAIFVLAGLAVVQPAFASKSTILDPYLKLQDALSSDQFKTATSAAKKLTEEAKAEITQSPEKKALYSGIAKEAEDVAKSSDLAKARVHFKKLSDLMMDWSKKEKPEGVQAMHCAMYPGNWLQKKGETRNPYYGKEMQSCGEAVSDPATH